MRFHVFALVGLFIASPLVAQGRIIPHPCLQACVEGRPCTPCRPLGPAIVRTASHVSVKLTNGILNYEITETFVNHGAGLGEADYLFPLPRGAAFQDLRLSINGELVSGEIMDATRARDIYETIVRSQRDPALVEWMGHGLLRTRIFPLNRGESRKVVVRYQMVARREGKAFRVDYFQGTQPQIASGSANVRVERRQTSSRVAQPSSSFTLAYPAGKQFGNAYSPTNTIEPVHPVKNDPGYRQVAIQGNAENITVLIPLLSKSSASITILPYAPGNRDAFAMITLSPPPVVSSRVTPRDVTIVVDVSGSMQGTKMTQARAAVKQLLHTFESHDRFRIIDFSSDVRMFRDDYVAADRTNIQSAAKYIDALEASGSTNISAALEAALETPLDAALGTAPGSTRTITRRHQNMQSRLPLVLFITDGEATVGETRPDVIADQAARRRGDARVFTFGLGADVNVSLIEQLALQGRGTAQFVRPNESIEDALSLTARRLARPLVTNVRLRAEGVQLIAPLPDIPSDIFAGQDLVVLTRYRGTGHARVVFEGTTINGPVTWTTNVHFPDRARENPFVARLWATQRVGYLAAEKRKQGGSAEIDAEIKSLGEQYGIPTEFSSYLVQEPNLRLDAVGAPRQMSGAMTTRTQRFESARRASAQRAAKSLATADAAVEASGPHSSPTRRAGNRLFIFRDSVWTDTRARGTLEVVRIKPYSNAYFALLTAIPDLAQPFALGNRVIVVGQNIAIELMDSGLTDLKPDLTSRIQKRW